MCTEASSMLLHEEIELKNCLRRVDCSKLPPQYTGGFHQAKYGSLRDMCMTNGVLVCLYEGWTEDTRGLFAQNRDGKLLWRIQGAVGGKDMIQCVSVTTDDCGHLFVCDMANQCIQMFSTDGLYLGCLVKKGEHGIGEPKHVRWCKKTSSLIVVHQKYVHNQGYRYYISILKTDLM